MAWKENTFTTYEGHIDGFSQKAVRFKAECWTDYKWLPRKTKNGDPMMEIITHDHDSGEATVKVVDWLIDKNEWERP